MKKTIRLTESDIRRMVMETMDAWEDAIYKKNQDKEFRHRYGLGQGWPHYDHEDYDNGIWQDDDGKYWTVYPGERQATCLDDVDDTFDGGSLDEAVTRAIRKYLK